MHPAPKATPGDAAVLRRPGRVDYSVAFRGMQDFTDARTPETPDEIWLLEHPPVFTLGLNCQTAPPAGPIPVVRSDRGGDITYHGPGQLVVYLLLDLRRRGWGVRRLVDVMEQAIIDTLADYGVTAARRAGAPGVYVPQGKIASLGLRVRRGGCYHGLALNLDMDLAPFRLIRPCGLRDTEAVQLADLVQPIPAFRDVRAHLLQRLCGALDAAPRPPGGG